MKGKPTVVLIWRKNNHFYPVRLREKGGGGKGAEPSCGKKEYFVEGQCSTVKKKKSKIKQTQNL